MKKKIKYLGAAISVILMLSLLTACGEQSYQEEERQGTQSETVDSAGFETVGDSSFTSDSDETEESKSETTNTDSETTEPQENENDNDGTVDLPILPL